MVLTETRPLVSADTVLQITCGVTCTPPPSAAATIRAEAIAWHSSWDSSWGFSRPTIPTLLPQGSSPECPLDPVPPGSGPSLCPHGQSLRFAALTVPACFVPAAPSRPLGRRPTSAPAHKSFPLLFSSLHHPANINSSFQTHLSCLLLGDACPHAYRRINHRSPCLVLFLCLSLLCRELAVCLLVSLTI